ncbi:phosphosulfolactate synthase [Desmospora profundinema]|uniref:Phosphosulfolactate synthase n=1 Tax=Desmospora profundinema TaxID=1571184 RepID=A0ABU1ILK1_9BACL|nr:phosphosulfolactate synthase [Desmospora profundinema]MDR6224665.1 phosphosulfolactate synthase [Desmospora profundinema]
MKDPTRQRKEKPRDRGLTMVIDKGLGLGAYRDVIQLAGSYIDFMKLGFGTAVLTPVSLLAEKLRLSREADIHLYPGGTFFEVAYQQQGVQPYLDTLQAIGFEWVEISDGTISLSEQERIDTIQTARNRGFRVITEIGKKESGSTTPIRQLIAGFYRDMEAGADYVIVEGRESGKNVGIFDANGQLDSDYLLQVGEEIDHRFLIWECPQHSQQVHLFRLLGPEANVGNIAVGDILSVESLRRGLRSDTFYAFLPSPLRGGSRT